MGRLGDLLGLSYSLLESSWGDLSSPDSDRSRCRIIQAIPWYHNRHNVTFQARPQGTPYHPSSPLVHQHLPSNPLVPQCYISSTTPANTISSKQTPGTPTPCCKHNPSKHHIIQAAPWYTSIFQATPRYPDTMLQAQPQQTPYHPSSPLVHQHLPSNPLVPQWYISSTTPANTISSKQTPGTPTPCCKHNPSKHHIIQAAPWYTSIFQATPWYPDTMLQAQPQQTPYHPSSPLVRQHLPSNPLVPQHHVASTTPANTISSKQPPGTTTKHFKHESSKHHIIQAAPWYTSIFQATPWYHNAIVQARPQQTPYHPSNPLVPQHHAASTTPANTISSKQPPGTPASSKQPPGNTAAAGGGRSGPNLLTLLFLLFVCLFVDVHLYRESLCKNKDSASFYHQHSFIKNVDCHWKNVGLGPQRAFYITF